LRLNEDIVSYETRGSKNTEAEEKSRKRKRKETVSRSPDSTREEPVQSPDDQPLQLYRKPKKERKPDSLRVSDDCFVCRRALNECTDLWAELISDKSSAVMLLDRYGTMLNGPAAPTVETLYEFLCAHAEFTPVLPSHKILKKRAGDS
uniref:Smr domain-containing protein n=1 Tax=Gongylonema pulchrum TaxID=637853 RepID=A0A183ENF0_9BILA